ncbi:MAG: DUF4124 domain-containing protein [Casimicrobiaceae bacterium]
MMLRKSIFLATACGVAAALVTTLAFGVMYKWVDDNGRVVYGDTPPAGVKAERMGGTVAPADPAAVRDLANKDAQIRKRAQQREDDSAKQEKNLADANLRRTQCQQAIGRSKSLRDDANVYRYNEKGERVYLNAAMREESIAQNQKLMRDLGCTPAIQP